MGAAKIIAGRTSRGGDGDRMNRMEHCDNMLGLVAKKSVV
jgi:hypothetical protein